MATTRSNGGWKCNLLVGGQVPQLKIQPHGKERDWILGKVYSATMSTVECITYLMSKESFKLLLWVKCNSHSCHIIRSYETTCPMILFWLDWLRIVPQIIIQIVWNVYKSHQKNCWEQINEYFLKRTMTYLKEHWWQYTFPSHKLFFSLECYIQKGIFHFVPPSFCLSLHLLFPGLIFNMQI